MTRRRRHKVRDSEETKRQLLAAVENLLLRDGFTGLKTNRIAREIGKDKNLIRYYYGGLNNLLKTFIATKDYWVPFLERYQLIGQSNPKELKEAFISMMQENFNTFLSNGDMQRLILWQISEANPLMRSISENRERQGEKLFRLTDPVFRDSDVDFRSVVGLLLGGIYFVTLQGAVDTSVVCGRDAKRDHDRKVLIKTIRQVITWAWREAEQISDSNKNRITMNQALENLVEQGRNSLAADTVEQWTKFELGLPTMLGQAEQSLLEQLMNLGSETQIRTFLQVYLARLVDLSNELLAAGPDRYHAAKQIALLAETVAKPVIQALPSTFLLPEVFRREIGAKMEELCRIIRQRFTDHGVDPLLVNICLAGFERFNDPKGKPRWARYRYLKLFQAYLDEFTKSAEILDDGKVIDALIAFGYNTVRLPGFIYGLIRKSVDGLPYPEQKLALKKFSKHFQQISLQTMQVYSNRRPQLVTELADWIEAEIDYGFAANPLKRTDSMKLNTSMKGSQLAFWNKLQKDHGVYEEDNLDVFSEKVAHNFTSKGQEDLSPASIKSKLYAKDASVIDPIEDLLAAMLEDVRRFKK